MHYQHVFHAGNFADVFKHVVLCGLLQAMNRKPAAWCYLETHAGSGSYDLTAEPGTRNPEWRDGVARLPDDAAGMPEPLATLLRVVAAENPEGGRRRYPGSPAIVHALARTGDRLLLCEKSPKVAALLRQRLRERNVAVHERDGYESHSLLPPKEKRGLILSDPPFERRDEFQAMGDFLERSLARFAAGVYALWYPIKNRFEAQRFERRVARQGAESLAIRFDHGAAVRGRMGACGMAIVNAPYRLDADLRPALATLVRLLGQGRQAGFEIEELA